MAVDITSNGGGATAAINVTEGSTAVTTVVATRPALTFAKSGTDAAAFSINSSTGALTFASAPDYETPTDADVGNDYVVAVTVTDPVNSSTATQTLTVNVTDVAETGGANYDLLKARLDSVLLGVNNWTSNAKNNPCTHPAGAGLLTVVDGYNRFNAAGGLYRATQATGQESYTQQLLTWSEQYIDVGADYDSDGWDDWGTCYTGTGYNSDHYEWRAACVVAYCLMMLIDNPSFSISTAPNKLELAEFLRDQVWLKWQPGNIPTGSNVYSVGTTNIGRVGIICLALDAYYGPFGVTTYSAFLTDRGTQMKNHLDGQSLDSGSGANIRSLVNSPYDTSANTSLGSVGTMDVSHNTDVVRFMTLGYERGYSWMPLASIQKLAHTFTNRVWNGDGFNRNWDGSSAISNDNVAKIAVNYFDLLKYNDTERAAMETWILTPSSYNGTNGYSIGNEHLCGAYGSILYR